MRDGLARQMIGQRAARQPPSSRFDRLRWRLDVSKSGDHRADAPREITARSARVPRPLRALRAWVGWNATPSRVLEQVPADS